jgi:glycosyltransferase involved in cell wall biosynthesis
MKIGIEAQRLFRKNKHGMEIVALELLNQIRQLEYMSEFQFVLFVKEGPDSQCIQPSGNLKIVRVPGSTYLDWEQYYLPRAVKKEGIDILHCTCNTGPLLIDIPIILTLHDIIFLESVNFSGTFYQNFGNLYRRWIVPRLLPKCSSIVTVSKFEKGNIMRWFPTYKDQVHTVYNGLNEKFRVIDDQSYLQKLQIKYKLPERFILFLGSRAPKKNTEGVLRAYQSFCQANETPLPLVITDYDKSWLPSYLTHSVKKQIIVLHFAHNDELPYIYNLATLFLYPSLRESFGMPILESMACGTPVVTSNVSSMPEIAGGAALLVDPTNSLEIAEAIQMLANDAKLYAFKRNQGLRRILKFSWKKTSLIMLELYKSLITHAHIT